MGDAGPSLSVAGAAVADDVIPLTGRRATERGDRHGLLVRMARAAGHHAELSRQRQSLAAGPSAELGRRFGCRC